MAFTVNGNTLTHSGTDNGLSGLGGISGVTANGLHYNVGLPITRFVIEGNLTIEDYETLQLDDSVLFSRVSGGSLTMKPFSTIEIVGNARGADNINNSFRAGFTFNTEILNLGAGRIQAPTFREATSGRSDTFATSLSDFANGPGDNFNFNIQGLNLICEPVISAKFYASSSSTLNGIYLKRNGNNFTEFQFGFKNGAETKVLKDAIFDNFVNLATAGGATQVGSLFLLESPKYLFPSDFTISLVNIRSDVETIELRDISSVSVGQWDNTITQISRGIVTSNTQKRTYLSGTTPVAGIKTVYTPTGSIGSEITELSNAQGETKQVLVTGQRDAGAPFTGVLPQETWTIVAVGYEKRLASSSFRLTDAVSPETSEEVLQVIDAPVNEIDKSIVDAYTEIDTANKFNDRSVSFVVDNPVGLSDWIVTQSGDTIDAGSYDVELRSGGSEVFAFDGTTISVRVGNTFIGNITTTGVVQENTTQVLGSITDSNSFRSNKVITLTGIANPSKVHLFNAGLTPTDLDYEIDTQLVTNGTYSFVFKAGQNITADVRVNSLQNRIIEFNVLLGLNDINIPISQQTDRIYENN